MRLNELRPIPTELRDLKNNPKTQNFSWLRDIDDYLTKYGYKGIGRGAYGAVYKHEQQNKVLKVFRKDPLYKEWVKFCRSNRDNPFVPQFRSDLIDFKDDIYGVLLEPLQSSGDDGDTISRIIGTIVELLPEVQEFRATGVIPKGAAWIDRFYAQYESSFEYLLGNTDFLKVAEYLYAHRNDVDMRQENIMRRGRQYVITDPLAS